MPLGTAATLLAPAAEDAPPAARLRRGRRARRRRHAFACSEIEHREQVLLVAVDPARRQQPQHVQSAAGSLRRSAGRAQLGIGEETAVLDRRIDAGEILVDDAAGAEIHVPHFGIAHLPVRKADMAAFGMDQGVRTLRPQPAPVRKIGQRQRVVRGILAMAPTVQDQQHDGLRTDGSRHMTFGAVT